MEIRQGQVQRPDQGATVEIPKEGGFIIVMSGAQPIMCLLLPVKRIHSQD